MAAFQPHHMQMKARNEESIAPVRYVYVCVIDAVFIYC